MAKAKRRSDSGRLSRRFPSNQFRGAASYKLHAQLVGEVVFAWNELQKSYALAFWRVMGDDRGWLYAQIWSALASDTAQRDILKAALNSGYFANSKATRALLWGLRETGKLAVYRNDFVHTAMTPTLGPSLLPSTSGTPLNRYIRMHQVDANRLLRALRGDLLQLSAYVDAAARQIGKEGAQPPLRRPRLRTLGVSRNTAS